ncbi:hypothetical protein EJ065_3039 [Corallococcus coralloides]|uniref:Uncharacterized protein n=1 Tax=Corallococcus coralloides TaxID=184914 RepID=A0A410RRV7_CORCK|nr:hypothetical protein [Corallococcus coralloides]QAT84608.1 hypothetical protein EJ065_3039 [Corallococcus coralloides]
MNVNRTGNVNTALDVIARVNPDFGVFASGAVPRFDINDASAPDTAVRTGVDGTTLYQTPSGTLITGESFSGDDRLIQGKEISDAERDSGADATYGNAIYVAAPEQVTEAYTLALPNSAEEGALGAADSWQLAALANGNLTPEERDALMTRTRPCATRTALSPAAGSLPVSRARTARSGRSSTSTSPPPMIRSCARPSSNTSHRSSPPRARARRHARWW